MRFELYSDVNSFYSDVYEFMARDETRNMIPAGNVAAGYSGADKTGWRDPSGWLMATVSDGGAITLAALMTPPHNLTLCAEGSRADDGALSCLIDGLIAAKFTIGGVMTEKSLAERFAEIFSSATGAEYGVETRLRLYELTEVNPDLPYVGTLRTIRESDLAFLPYWVAGFGNDCFGSPLYVGSDIAIFRREFETKRVFVLEDGMTPVSTAKISRELRTVCGIAQVYTPPYFRGRGFATSCVAGVSRVVLERGYKKCALYTDLSNPTSNDIYQKIGYRPVCDSVEIKFKPQ